MRERSVVVLSVVLLMAFLRWESDAYPVNPETSKKTYLPRSPCSRRDTLMNFMNTLVATNLLWVHSALADSSDDSSLVGTHETTGECVKDCTYQCIKEANARDMNTCLDNCPVQCNHESLFQRKREPVLMPTKAIPKLYPRWQDDFLR